MRESSPAAGTVIWVPFDDCDVVTFDKHESEHTVAKDYSKDCFKNFLLDL